MKIELHCHTRRYSICAEATPAELMEHLIGRGYGAVYITEHDRMWGEWELAHLREEFPGIHIFPGVELSLAGGEHVLVLGTNDERYLAMRDDAGGVLRKARDEGHLTVLAHPYRWPQSAGLLDLGLLPDAIELKTCNHQTADQVSATLATASRLGLHMVHAGDVHALEMAGKYWIETAGPVAKDDDIRDIVLMGSYRNCEE